MHTFTDPVLPPHDPWRWQHMERVLLREGCTVEQEQAEIDRARAKLLRAIRHYCKTTDEEAEARLTFAWSGWQPAFATDRDTGATTVLRGYQQGWWSACPKREA